MKLAHRFAVPMLAAAISGCTVNHYHYHGSAEPSSIKPNLDKPGQTIMAERLVGIHAAMEVIANNIANTNTTGYKARRVLFEEGRPAPQITIDWKTQGSAIQTDGDFDVYINGHGFFQVEIESEKGNGIGYTRIGNFIANADSELVLGNSGGQRLADHISIPAEATSVSIASDGMITVALPDGSLEQVGQIELHYFLNPQALEHYGAGIYCETEASGPATNGPPNQGVFGSLLHGHLESSNVNLINEILEMEKLNRLAQALSRQLGPSISQEHALFARCRYATITDQIDLIHYLDENNESRELREIVLTAFTGAIKARP